MEKPLFEPKEEEIEEADSLDWIGYDEYVKTQYEGEDKLQVLKKEVVRLPSV